MGAKPGGGFVDGRQRRLIAGLRSWTPGEKAVAAEHDALQVRIGFGEPAELEAEIEAGPAPGQKADLAVERFLRQRFGFLARRDRNHRVGVHVIDMDMRHEGMQRRIDRSGARIEIKGAVVEERDHLVFVLEAAIDGFEAKELVEIERREAVDLHRADIAARAFDPKNRDPRAAQRIGLGDLGRGVAAAEIGDPEVAAEQVRAVDQQTRLIELRRVGVVPQIRKGRVEAGSWAAHGSFLADFERF